MIDSSSVRVHQHGANHCPAGESILSPGGGPKKGGDPVALPTIASNHLPSGTWVARAAGLTTKIHALVDALGRPIRLKLTPGQAQDGRLAADMFGTVRAGQTVFADRAYDSDAPHETLTARGAFANIRLMPNGVRLFPFDRNLYKARNAVERFFNKLKRFRAVATRYDKRDDNDLTSVQLASIRIWLWTYVSVT